MDSCRICGGEQVPAYCGPVRQGTFGRFVDGQVWRCQNCGVEFLPPMVADLEEYYKSNAYRTEVGEQSDIADYFRLHDTEQLPRMALLEPVPLRGKVIADIGCGGGSFLDCVRGLASQTVAVEPMLSYHSSLMERGHRVYSSATAASGDWATSVDLAVCFSVIEHVDDPLTFLRQIRDLLRPGAKLLLSTPNRRDILMESGCAVYQSFFYRTVHIYYFDADSLRYLARAAGFTSCDVRFVHRFGFGNYLAWLRDGQPTQHTRSSPLGDSFDRMWVLQVEQLAVSDYLFAFLHR